MSQLVVRDLHKTFPGTPAPSDGQAVEVLRGVDLTVAEGTLAAVLGPSGCGKTTLLRVVAGFEPADAGTITLGGQQVAGPGRSVPPERRRIGFVPQEGALFPHLDVAGNVGFGLPRRQRDRSARVAQALALVGLDGYQRRLPRELSGGQQQRVSLARALAPDPALVLLDEPFSALDSGLRSAVRADVRAALTASGATAVLVTHDQEEALSMADLVAVMTDGRIAQAAPPASLYRTPADLGVAQFVGDAVVLPAHARDGQVPSALGLLTLHPGSTSGSGTVVIRPEQIAVVPWPATGAPARARVVATTFFGHDSLLRLTLEGAVGVDGRSVDVSARRLAQDDPVQVGDQVGLEVVGPVSFFAGA